MHDFVNFDDEDLLILKYPGGGATLCPPVDAHVEGVMFGEQLIQILSASYLTGLSRYLPDSDIVCFSGQIGKAIE